MQSIITAYWKTIENPYSLSTRDTQEVIALIPIYAFNIRLNLLYTSYDVWALRDSNPRHSRCKRDALPTELSALF